MKRRDLIVLLGGAAIAVAPSGAVNAQRDRTRHIGVLVGNASGADEPFAQQELRPFREAMRDAGWIEGKNIKVDYRFAPGDRAQLLTFASELVALAPELIYALTTGALEAVHQKTRTIPIVFSQVADPIGIGAVASLAHPGGNVTGFVSGDPPIAGKCVELLKEIAPGLSRIGIMFNPEVAPYAAAFITEAERAIGHDESLVKYPVRDDPQIDEAVSSLAREPHSGLVILADPFTAAHQDHIYAAATRLIPTTATGRPLGQDAAF